MMCSVAPLWRIRDDLKPFQCVLTSGCRRTQTILELWEAELFGWRVMGT